MMKTVHPKLETTPSLTVAFRKGIAYSQTDRQKCAFLRPGTALLQHVGVIFYCPGHPLNIPRHDIPDNFLVYQNLAPHFYRIAGWYR